MTSTVFTSGTVIVSPWLNDINAAIYTAIANSSGSPPTTTAQVVTNLSQAGGLATQNTTQTLTNKTLTNPTVTTGTFTSPAIATPTVTNPTVSTGTFTSPTMITPVLGVATGTSLALTGLATVGTTLGVTGNTSLATTPVLYSGNGSVSSGRLIGRYSYLTATPATAYFFDYNNTSTISAADAVIAALLATTINTTITNANALTAFGTSYGAKNAGLSFVSGTGSDITRVVTSLSPLLNADINAVVVGYTAVGPRILIQNYALNDDTANAISYVGDVHRFYYGGSEVATISSTGLNVTGSLTVNGGLIGAVQTLSGPGAVDLTTTITKFTSTAPGNALTLANGTNGQIKTIVHFVGGGSGVLTPTNLGNGTTITFTNVGDSCILQFVDTDWWVFSLQGAVLA